MSQDESRAWKDQYMLRFPDGMRDRLKQAAVDNNRSMNAEIIARLEASFATAGSLADLFSNLQPPPAGGWFGLLPPLTEQEKKDAAMLAEALRQSRNKPEGE